MSRRRRKEQTKRKRFTVGRTFADKDRPLRWYVFLPVDGCYTLVWWDRGKPRTTDANKVRLDARDFPVSQLLARWGITSEDLDAFLEQRLYRWDADVRKVRSERQPLNGRTVLHVPHKHRVQVRGR